jgi:hypothetical protein
LAPIQAHWGQEAVAGLCRIWQVEEQCRRRQLCSADRQQLNAIWQTAFEATARLLGDDLFEAWEDVQALLGLNWRGSNAAAFQRTKVYQPERLGFATLSAQYSYLRTR